MEDKELQELEEFSLEDIINEFSDHPHATPAEEEMPAQDVEEEVASQEEPVEAEEVPVEEVISTAEELPAAEETEAEEIIAEETESVCDDTVVFETVEEVPAEDAAVTDDTIRLDSPELLKGMARDARQIEEEEASDTVEEHTEQWEPEYEQPMGAYVPPRPIIFPTRAESREMKRKLIIGPEKKYYELTEKGLGKLQICMFFALLVVVVSAISTVAYAQGMIPENRLRLMIFGQFLAVLVSALLGSFQLIQGVADLFKGRFTLNTLLVVTFVACCADGVFCLLQERIPCCAAFSLEVLMTLWGTYNRRHAELGQMDVLRKAAKLRGVCAKADAYEGKAVLGSVPGRVEDFMDNYDQPTQPQKRQDVYALIALAFSVAIGVFTGLMQDLYTGIQMTAVSLLAAVPATAFIATTVPSPFYSAGSTV